MFASVAAASLFVSGFRCEGSLATPSALLFVTVGLCFLVARSRIGSRAHRLARGVARVSGRSLFFYVLGWLFLGGVSPLVAVAAACAQLAIVWAYFEYVHPLDRSIQ